VDESLSQQDLLVDYLTDDLLYGEDLDLAPSLDGVEDRDDLVEYFRWLESYHGIPLYDNTLREFVALDGDANLSLSGDNPALVLLESDKTASIVDGGDHVFVCKGSLGEMTIEGGETTVFFESLPGQESEIEVRQGVLKLNFIPGSFGDEPEIVLDGNRVIIDGADSNIRLKIVEEAIPVSEITISVLADDVISIGELDLPSLPSIGAGDFDAEGDDHRPEVEDYPGDLLTEDDSLFLEDGLADFWDTDVANPDSIEMDLVTSDDLYVIDLNLFAEYHEEAVVTESPTLVSEPETFDSVDFIVDGLFIDYGQNDESIDFI
jgi:hypothetical protein